MKASKLSLAIHQTTGDFKDSIRKHKEDGDRLAAHFNRCFNRAYNDAKYDILKGR